MDRKYANYLLKKTRRDYNRIADIFTTKRERISPDILYLKKYAQNGDKILDLGCGSGRLSKIFDPNIDYIGTDVSKEFIRIAKNKYPDKKFIKTDYFLLPFSDSSFDKIFCLSVIHHIPSITYRLKLLKEIKRVLKPGGKLILSVWSVWQNPKIKKIMLKYKLKKLFGLSEMDYGDILLPFKNNQGKVLAQRYIHCYTQKELEKLVSDAGYKVKLSIIQKRDKSGENKNILLVATI